MTSPDKDNIHTKFKRENITIDEIDAIKKAYKKGEEFVKYNGVILKNITIKQVNETKPADEDYK